EAGETRLPRRLAAPRNDTSFISRGSVTPVRDQLGIEVDDALSISEQVELQPKQPCQIRAATADTTAICVASARAHHLAPGWRSRCRRSRGRATPLRRAR